MNEPQLAARDGNPVVVGGVGGSGTRLIARCLEEIGVFIGDDRNHAHDNLWFTLLFKRAEILDASDEEFDRLVGIFTKAMTGRGTFTRGEINLVHRLAYARREQHSRRWLMERAYTLLFRRSGPRPYGRWGWKEPNSHIVVDRLKARLPGMKYIHVVRHGLDMAHSRNQNQLRLWGRHFLGGDVEITPRDSLRYWCIVHRRVLEIGAAMPGDFLFLNYDRFCLNPEEGIEELCGFLGVEVSDARKSALLRLVSPPESMGIFRKFGTGIFAAEDVAFVRELGFDVDEGP